MIDIQEYKTQELLIDAQTYSDSFKSRVTSIFDDVKQNKDDAVIKYTKKYDAPDMSDSFKLIVSEAEIKEAYSRVSDSFRKALDIAIENITEFHSYQLPTSWMKESSKGYYFGMQYQPLDIAGLYVPGGKALYPSSVCMNAIPAKIAGVANLVMTTPPLKDGSIAPELLVAAQECGVDNIVKAGGAQAIFALALGTKSITKVDKIVGPGNAYVDCAKQMVYGLVDIDKPAGPSEVLVYVEDVKYAHYAAAELLTQCEHDPDANGAVISNSKTVLEAVQVELEKQFNLLDRKEILTQSLKNSSLFFVSSREDAIDAINEIATEHLSLLIDDVDPFLPKIKHAGAIFCGPYTPVTMGDYIAGPNHVLPTARAARFSSALSVMDFMKFSSVLNCDKDTLKTFSSHIKTLTSIEKLDGHNKAVEIRLKK